MSAVRNPHRSDTSCMARSGQPVVYGGTDFPALNGRFSLALMPRNQQQNPVAGRDRALKCPVDRIPGAIEAMTMQVEDPIWVDPSQAKPAVPAAV